MSENVEKPRISNSFRKTTQTPPIEDCQRRQKAEIVRRKTVPNLQKRKPLYGQIFSESFEDNIYEEIDDVGECDKDTEEMSFLRLISSERRKNLKLYGSTGWDFELRYIE